MKKQQKLFLIAIVSFLILPQITFAAWWNPFTWFTKPSSNLTPVNLMQTTISSSTVTHVTSIEVKKDTPKSVALPKVASVSVIDLPQSSSDTNINKTLIFGNPLTTGMSGEQVNQLQVFLQSQGCFQGTLNGIFDRLTLHGVKCFQIKYNLPITGSFDLPTEVIANNLIQGTTLPLANRNDQVAIQERAVTTEISDLQQQISSLNQQYTQGCQNQTNQNLDVTGIAAEIALQQTENCTYVLNTFTLLQQELQYIQQNSTAQNTPERQIFNIEKQILDIKHQAFQQSNASLYNRNYSSDTAIGISNQIINTANNQIIQLQYQIQLLQQQEQSQ